MEKIRELLEAEVDITYQDVADKCHIDLRNAREYMKILHADGEIHICGYLPWSIPLFRNGPGVDAKKKSRRQRDVVRVMNYRHRRNAQAAFKSASKAPSITAFLLGV